MLVVLVKILEALFLIGVAGCLVTIPMAGWGYCSVLFAKDTDEEQQSRVATVQKSAAD